MATLYPADPQSRIRSTYGRIALNQIFDYFPYPGGSSTSMSLSQIQSDAYRYDWVWGSGNDDGVARPQAWRNANTQAVVSRYYIIEEDNVHVSGHDLNYWQTNHPDWILYACDSSGNPTHDIAYTPGDSFPDVALDIHNPAVVAYQTQNLLQYAIANGYNAVALDQVIFSNFMVGGNPYLGERENTSEYACGYYDASGTFHREYSGRNDPTWTQDVLNWVATMRQAIANSGSPVLIAVNHPSINATSPNEQALLQNVDITLDEAGFTDYGNYQNSGDAYLFKAMYNYMEAVESQGKAVGIIDKFYQDGGSSVPANITPSQMEYSIASYMMANEGNADLFIVGNNGVGYGYGSEQYHPEYSTQLGAPCGAMYGGPSYDSNNPQIYYRRFQSGMVVLNSGSNGVTEQATLPANHQYTDMEGRGVTNPLPIASNDAYVLTTPGNGCL